MFKIFKKKSRYYSYYSKEKWKERKENLIYFIIWAIILTFVIGVINERDKGSAFENHPSPYDVQGY